MNYNETLRRVVQDKRGSKIKNRLGGDQRGVRILLAVIRRHSYCRNAMQNINEIPTYRSPSCDHDYIERGEFR